ncbi:MAG: hypothetical protein ABI343_20865, partial [Burkholderiaceae bacterium]
LVWLFALASGVANACLIQVKEIPGHGSLAAHSSPAENGHAFSAAHVGAIPKHDTGLEASKSQCLKVCDDGSQSLTKQQAAIDLTFPDLAPLLALAWTTATPGVSARGLPAFELPPEPGLPVRVRLSRLAL